MKSQILKKEINQLKKRYGNHTIVSVALGIDSRYYRRIRNTRGGLVSRLMRYRFDQVLSDSKVIVQ